MLTPSLLANYVPLNITDAAEAERFVATANHLSSMVDRIVELLPLYLAISQQPSGAYRLLVMVRPVQLI